MAVGVLAVTIGAAAALGLTVYVSALWPTADFWNSPGVIEEEPTTPEPPAASRPPLPRGVPDLEWGVAYLLKHDNPPADDGALPSAAVEALRTQALLNQRAHVPTTALQAAVNRLIALSPSTPLAQGFQLQALARVVELAESEQALTPATGRQARQVLQRRVEQIIATQQQTGDWAGGTDAWPELPTLVILEALAAARKHPDAGPALDQTLQRGTQWLRERYFPAAESLPYALRPAHLSQILRTCAQLGVSGPETAYWRGALDRVPRVVIRSEPLLLGNLAWLLRRGEHHHADHLTVRRLERYARETQITTGEHQGAWPPDGPLATRHTTSTALILRGLPGPGDE
jgi:hypothetical protein